jgi:chitin disaccharide deacetylase
MAASPLWPHEARALRGLDAEIQTGLHLDLTHFPPLGARLQRFALDGKAPRLAALAEAMRRAVPLGALRDEIQRQFDRFEAHFGAAPDFVDGHQHVHALPGVRSALADAIASRDPTFRPWLRNPGDSTQRILARRTQAAKAFCVRALSAGFCARTRGFAHNDGFAGFSGFDPSQNYRSAFARYLAAPGSRHLVMCHPGDEEPSGGRPAQHAASRRRELAFLLSAEFSNLLEESDFSLARGPIFIPP